MVESPRPIHRLDAGIAFVERLLLRLDTVNGLRALPYHTDHRLAIDQARVAGLATSFRKQNRVFADYIEMTGRDLLAGQNR